LQQLEQHCQHLRPTCIAQTLSSHLDAAAQQELSYSAFLETLLATEVAAKHEKHQAMRVQMARFPFHKTLDGFDRKAQKSIDPKIIKELATMCFVANGANALLLGPPRTGKRHRAQAPGQAAIQRGHRVLYREAHVLLEELTDATLDGTRKAAIAALSTERSAFSPYRLRAAGPCRSRSIWSSR